MVPFDLYLCDALRATAPSRLAPPSRIASIRRARGHQPMMIATQPAAAASAPAAVRASGEMPRRTEPWIRNPSLRVYRCFSAYRDHTRAGDTAHILCGALHPAQSCPWRGPGACGSAGAPARRATVAWGQ